jgi:hypothetical protein
MTALPALPLLLVLCVSLDAVAARGNDFPTLERVLYVQECVRNHPGQPLEMTSKCSCALDALAKEVSFDQYVTLSTVSKAMSIGGERGSAIRDVPSLEPQVKRYRELQARAETGCFLRRDAKP